MITIINERTRPLLAGADGNKMDQQSAEFKRLLASVCSDETAMFRSPSEPDPGDALTVYLRLQKGTDAAVSLLLGPSEAEVPMFRTRTDGVFDW